MALSGWDHYNLARVAAIGGMAGGTKAGAEMAEKRTILVCSCENTMPLDADAISRGCRGAQVTTANQLCRAEIERFRAAAASGARSPSAARRRRRCSRKSPASDPARSPSSTCAKPRGWSKDAASAGPKMAALLAMAAEPLPEIPYVSLDSEGVALIYGRDESAIEAGKLLANHLDVTVLIARAKGVTPPRVTDFPVVQGTIKSAKGHLGAFELVVDDYAAAAPSSRGELTFVRRAMARCPAAISCSICPRRAVVRRRRSARRLSPRRPGRSRRGAARRAQGARSHRHIRQAALHHLHRGSVRAFALPDRRLPPLPRPLSRRCDRAERRSHVPIDAKICAGCGNAPPPVRPAPQPMRCRPPTR